VTIGSGDGSGVQRRSPGRGSGQVKAFCLNAYKILSVYTGENSMKSILTDSIMSSDNAFIG